MVGGNGVKRFWDWLLKHSWGVVVVFVIVTGLMLVQVSKIQLDTSADAVNPDNNAIVKLNKEIQKEFNSGKSEFFVLHADNVFTAGHLNEIRVITENLKALTGVLRVTSLSNTTKMIETDGVLEISDMAPHDNMSAAEIADIRRYLDANYMMKSGLLAARDGTSTNVVVEFADSVDLPTIAGQMEKEVAETWTGTYDLTGVPTIEAYMLDTIRRDLPLLGGIAFLIILVLFAVNYRSFLGVWTPLLQVTIGLVWGAGIFGWMGMKFQPMTDYRPGGHPVRRQLFHSAPAWSVFSRAFPWNRKAGRHSERPEPYRTRGLHLGPRDFNRDVDLPAFRPGHDSGLRAVQRARSRREHARVVDPVARASVPRSDPQGEDQDGERRCPGPVPEDPGPLDGTPSPDSPCHRSPHRGRERVWDDQDCPQYRPGGFLPRQLAGAQRHGRREQGHRRINNADGCWSMQTCRTRRS